jgi:hypothetical protein
VLVDGSTRVSRWRQEPLETVQGSYLQPSSSNAPDVIQSRMQCMDSSRQLRDLLRAAVRFRERHRSRGESAPQNAHQVIGCFDGPNSAPWSAWESVTNNFWDYVADRKVGLSCSGGNRENYIATRPLRKKIFCYRSQSRSPIQNAKIHFHPTWCRMSFCKSSWRLFHPTLRSVCRQSYNLIF